MVSPTNTANYKYDGLGRRVEKEVIDVGTTVTRYVYDNEDILIELNGSNAITARYTHGPGIDEPLIMEKNSQSFYYHADGLGSIMEVTNQSGSLAQRYTYSSFGKIESQLDQNFLQPYTFTGREFDLEIGLYYYRERYYDPSTGRFSQQDPVAGLLNMPETIHQYIYVGNQPLKYIDPYGLFVFPLTIEPTLRPENTAGLVPPAPEWHRNRNKNQEGLCPPTEPTCESKWKKDPPWLDIITRFLHSGAQCYRGIGNAAGAQCCYRDGRFDAETSSYDYSPPDVRNPRSVWEHIKQDVMPGLFWGNNPRQPKGPSA